MFKKKRHIFSVVLMLLLIIFGIGYVKATDEVTQTVNQLEEQNSENVSSIFDSKIVDGVYKTSENSTNMYLPFIRFVTDRMIVDSEITKSGFSFANKSIEINSPMKGVQVMFSSDTIRVNSNVEYGVLIANGNIIIDSQISKDLVLISTGTITISENAKLNENLICVCQNLELKGNVEQSVIGSAVVANITGNIENDLRLMSNDVKLSSNQNVKNNIYIETYNKDLNISDQYKNVTVVLKEVKKQSEFTFDKIMSMFITCLVFTLMYIVINKIAKKNVFLLMLNKVKENSSMVIVSGALLLLACLPIFFVLLILSMIGIWAVTVPILIIYIVFLVIIYILNIFVIGSLLYSYIKEKYLKSSGIGTDILGAFCMFLVLSVLTKIPLVGPYILLIMYILSLGIVFTLIFKRKKANN